MGQNKYPLYTPSLIGTLTRLMKIFNLLESVFLFENFQLALKDFSADNDVETVKAALDRFKKLQPRISDAQLKDINHWRKEGFDKMLSFLDKVENTDSKRQRIKKVKAASDDILTIKKEGDVHLFVPLSKEASCFYGSGTPWCISTRDGDNYFYSYTIARESYVVFLIKGEDIYALVMNQHGAISEVQDKRNKNDIPRSEFFEMAGMSEKEVYSFLSKHRDVIMDETLEKAGSVVIDQLLGLLDDVEENEPTIYKILTKNTLILRKMRRGAVSEKVKKLEAEMAKDAFTAYQYANHIVEGRWPEGEAAISKSARHAYQYATILEMPWPEGEAAIMTRPMPAAAYSAKVLKRRWPEAEPIIAQDASAAVNYAMYVIEGRWPEAEPAILAAGAEAAYKYAKFAIKDRWPEGEEVIFANPDIAKHYRRDLL